MSVYLLKSQQNVATTQRVKENERTGDKEKERDWTVVCCYVLFFLLLLLTLLLLVVSSLFFFPSWFVCLYLFCLLLFFTLAHE